MTLFFSLTVLLFDDSLTEQYLILLLHLNYFLQLFNLNIEFLILEDQLLLIDGILLLNTLNSFFELGHLVLNLLLVLFRRFDLRVKLYFVVTGRHHTLTIRYYWQLFSRSSCFVVLVSVLDIFFVYFEHSNFPRCLTFTTGGLRSNGRAEK